MEQEEKDKLKYLTIIDSIIQLIIEAAEARKLPTDYVSRLYQVQMDVLGRVTKIMEQQRQEERDAKGKEDEPKEVRLFLPAKSEPGDQGA